MNPRLEALHAYPFERLARLKAGITAPSQLEPIAMSIGEPQHTPPAFLLEALRRHLDRLGSYPATAGLPELRDRKSTRLNSSHVKISYAVFCLKKKNKNIHK